MFEIKINEECRGRFKSYSTTELHNNQILNRLKKILKHEQICQHL